MAAPHSPVRHTEENPPVVPLHRGRPITASARQFRWQPASRRARFGLPSVPQCVLRRIGPLCAFCSLCSTPFVRGTDSAQPGEDLVSSLAPPLWSSATHVLASWGVMIAGRDQRPDLNLLPQHQKPPPPCQVNRESTLPPHGAPQFYHNPTRLTEEIADHGAKLETWIAFQSSHRQVNRLVGASRGHCPLPPFESRKRMSSERRTNNEEYCSSPSTTRSRSQFLFLDRARCRLLMSKMRFGSQ